MSIQADEFMQAVTDLEDAYRRGIRAFAEWFSKEGIVTLEQWKRECQDAPPGGPEWFDGHNNGVESVMMMVDLFLDENLSR